MQNIECIKILKTEDDFLNIIIGGTFLGSGGGGPIEAGISMMNEILSLKREIKVLLPNEIENPKDLYGAVLAFVGSPTEGAKGIDFDSPVSALDTLKIYTPSKKIDFTLLIELGGGNSLVPILVAGKKDIFVIDGDGAGRAVPQIQNTVYALNANATPAVFSNGPKGEVGKVKIDNIITMGNISKEQVPDKLEEYCLELCETKEFGGLGAMALYLMNGEELQENIIPKTLSFSYFIGKMIREAINSNDNQSFLEKVKENLTKLGLEFYSFDNGEVIEVIKPNPESKNSLDQGLVKIKNKNEDILTLYYINESLFATILFKGEKTEKIWAMAPDLICYLSNEDYGTFSNVEIKKGMNVHVIGLKANEKMRNKKIIDSFMEILKKTNIYQGDYIKIEDLHK